MAVSDHVRRQLDDAPLAVPMQVIWTLGDAVISNHHVEDFVERQRVTKLTSACYLNDTVAHQFMSRYEHPGRPTPWMDDLLSLAEGFITSGRRRPGVSGKSSVACAG